MLRCRLNITPPFKELEFGSPLQIAWIKNAKHIEDGKKPFTKAYVRTGYQGYVSTYDGFVDERDNTVFADFDCLFCKKPISIEVGYPHPMSSEEALLDYFYREDASNIPCQKCEHLYSINCVRDVFVQTED